MGFVVGKMEQPEDALREVGKRAGKERETLKNDIPEGMVEIVILLLKDEGS